MGEHIFCIIFCVFCCVFLYFVKKHTWNFPTYNEDLYHANRCIAYLITILRTYGGSGVTLAEVTRMMRNSGVLSPAEIAFVEANHSLLRSSCEKN